LQLKAENRIRSSAFGVRHFRSAFQPSVIQPFKD
jgi:hypothetical protein